MRRLAAAGALAGLALAGGAPGAAAQGGPAVGDVPVVSTTHHRYEVEGTTAREVLESLRRGSRVVHGDSAFAWTESHTEYRTRHEVRAGRCRVTDVDVRVRLTVSLPRWTPGSGASSALRQQWNRFLRSLRIHEDGHVQIGRRGAARLREALSGLWAGSCDELEAVVRREGTRILDDLQEAHRRYDERTGHGARQGAVWNLDGGG